MSKAATTTDLATKQNGNAILNGGAEENHDDVASVDLEGENEEEESDEYDEDEEAEYEEDRQIAGDEDDEEGEEEEEGDEGQNALTHLLLGKPEVPVTSNNLGDEEDDEDDDEDEDDEYVEEPALDKGPSKKRSFNEVADEEDSQGAKKIKA